MVGTLLSGRIAWTAGREQLAPVGFGHGARFTDFYHSQYGVLLSRTLRKHSTEIRHGHHGRRRISTACLSRSF